MKKSTESKPPKPVANSRRAAAFIVARWLVTKDFPATMLPDGPDRAFVQDVVYTVIRHMRALRLALGRFVRQWPKGELEALLYVGAAQILYMPDVPDFAAVSETVKAAKACENKSIAKVVNGVLRNLIRQRAETEAAIVSAPLAERESYPDGLVEMWRARFGEAGAAALAAWHNQPAETFLAFPDGTFRPLARGRRVEDEDGFAQGAFIVQDPATALAVSLTEPARGEKILDACAAPGGEPINTTCTNDPHADTALLPSLLARHRDIHEVNPKRRRRLAENLARTRLDGQVDVIGELPAGVLYDKVLVDAPCSNTGVLRRRPDARWNWSADKRDALVRLQSDILEACAPRVRPGGALVYSTCSNDPQENQAQVAAFLARHRDFTLAREEESLPHETGHDGAYAAQLRRA